VVDETAALPITGSSTVLDYGSDSDAHAMTGDSLLRRRSLIRLRESRRRDSITKMCASCRRAHGISKKVISQGQARPSMHYLQNVLGQVLPL
jgi:hypothetical protein